MKVKIASELISVVTIGTLTGLHTTWMNWKWHRLGREAFLSHESQFFDKFCTNPAPAIDPIIKFVVAALIIFALYKGIAFVAAKVLSAIANKCGAEQG
jgi:hypothetical protein